MIAALLEPHLNFLGKRFHRAATILQTADNVGYRLDSLSFDQAQRRRTCRLVFHSEEDSRSIRIKLAQLYAHAGIAANTSPRNAWCLEW